MYCDRVLDMFSYAHYNKTCDMHTTSATLFLHASKIGAQWQSGESFINSTLSEASGHENQPDENFFQTLLEKTTIQSRGNGTLGNQKQPDKGFSYNLPEKNSTKINWTSAVQNQSAKTVILHSKTFSEECRDPSNMNLSHILHEPFITIPESFYIEHTKNCKMFRSFRGYISKPGTEEELKFPLAFSIIMYKDVDRAERLLRAIYTPQNFYCIHVDKSSNPKIHKAMNGIASCFDNVFTVSSPIAVEWGAFSVLQTELLCLRELWKYKSWKYFINLTGQEFPLQTNWELVQILSSFKGANDVDATSKM